MTPLDWACGRCDAQPSEPCVGMPAGTFHDERWAAVAAQTTNSEPVSKEDFDKAVEATGLV